MQDHQEMARQKAEVEASDRTSSRGQGSGSGLPYGLPATLPNLAAEEGIPAKPSGPAPMAPKQGKKRSHANDDDEITELPARDEPVVPPKKKKKKKSKDKAKEEVPVPGDGARPGSSSAKPEATIEPTPAVDPSRIPDEETEQPKKKKKKKKDKKDPGLEKFLTTGTGEQGQGDGQGCAPETAAGPWTSGRSGSTGKRFPRHSWKLLMGPTTANSCWKNWKRKAII